jgi:uncharacterized membrane protein
MSASEQSRIRTRMFARVMGPYLTIVPTTVAIRGGYMQELFTEFKANPMWPWLYGAILLMGGLFIIAFHQYWRGLAAIIVSAVGWFFLIRGVLLLTVPRVYDSAGNAIYNSGASAAIWVLFICLASAGLYLTYVGWKPETATTESVSGTTQDRPGAAGS